MGNIISCRVYIELSMRKNYHFHRKLNFNLVLGVKNHSHTSHKTTPQNTDIDNLDFITNYIGYIVSFLGPSYNYQKVHIWK